MRTVLPAEEFEAVSISRAGPHYKVAVPTRNFKLAIPASPSDHRWFKNWRASFLQQMGGRCLYRK